MGYLRREKVEVTAVDNERFGSRAWSVLSRKFSGARHAIVKFCQGDVDRARKVVENLRLDGAHLGVTHPLAEVSRFPGPATATGQALTAVKQALRTEGYFRYDDMFAFAEACLFKVPYVAHALRRRFPWVFVDELQDTSAVQDRIIEALFAQDGCVLQRFGDKNQAIFDFGADSEDTLGLFGRRPTLFLNTTHRFGGSVARLVSPLTAVKPQKVIGNPQIPDLPHTVFVFDRAAVKSVVSMFAELALAVIPEDLLRTRPVYVVGGRVNSARHSRDNFPVFLGEYWDGYSSPKSTKPATPDSLLGYIMEARKKWLDEGTGVEAYNCAMSGILALLRRVAPGPKLLPSNKTELEQALLRSEQWKEWRGLLWRLLNPLVSLDKQNWGKLMQELTAILRIAKLDDDALHFLLWEDCWEATTTPVSGGAVAADNTYLHRSGKKTLSVCFDSIHGVKGQTHAATLVVETFAKQHDLEQLIPVLAGAKHGSQLKVSGRGHCKRLFVAMSRPSHLLCLAISAEHIDGKGISGLEANGWQVVPVRNSGPANGAMSVSAPKPNLVAQK